jgi:hypothetical protein
VSWKRVTRAPASSGVVTIKKEGKLVETKITFHNKTEMRVMAQIFVGRALISTCMLDPGETRILSSGLSRNDIFFKNGTTGWEVGRKLDSDAKSFTLSKHQKQYTVYEARDNDPIELVTEPELTVKRTTK